MAVVVFPSYGVLTGIGGENVKFAKPIFRATINDDDQLDIEGPGQPTKTYGVGLEEITIDKNTGIIDFSTGDMNYRIRELREEDGLWLSKYKTPLPVEALKEILNREAKVSYMAYTPGQPLPQDETLHAVVFEGNKAVVGLLYNNEQGRWARIDGEWLLLTDQDADFEDDTIAIEISEDKADDFIDLFDKELLLADEIEEYTAQPDEDLSV